MFFEFSYGLEKQFNEDVYKDFEQLALEFYKKGNLYGLEKYWYSQLSLSSSLSLQKYAFLDFRFHPPLNFLSRF